MTAENPAMMALEGQLHLSNESIRVAREYFKSVGIETAFFDDVAGLACREILTLRDQSAKVDVLLDALQKLSRLGNGENTGNSIGNVIAQTALSQFHATEGKL